MSTACTSSPISSFSKPSILGNPPSNSKNAGSACSIREARGRSKKLSVEGGSSLLTWWKMHCGRASSSGGINRGITTTPLSRNRATQSSVLALGETTGCGTLQGAHGSGFSVAGGFQPPATRSPQRRTAGKLMVFLACRSGTDTY